MSAAPSPPPSDDELNRLLGATVRRTSPAFEQRWRELRGELSAGRSRRHYAGPWFWRAVALASAAFVVFSFVRVIGPHRSPRPQDYAVLLALDAALTPAEPLLNSDIRQAIINLPADQR